MRLLACLLLLVSGCAFAMHGDTQQVGISSTPSGVGCYINSDKYVTTPAFVSLDRSGIYTVVCDQQGYEKSSVTLSRNLSMWIVGDLFLLPPLGTIITAAVDVSSGAAWKLSPACRR